MGLWSLNMVLVCKILNWHYYFLFNRILRLRGNNLNRKYRLKLHLNSIGLCWRILLFWFKFIKIKIRTISRWEFRRWKVLVESIRVCNLVKISGICRYNFYMFLFNLTLALQIAKDDFNQYSYKQKYSEYSYSYDHGYLIRASAAGFIIHTVCINHIVLIIIIVINYQIIPVRVIIS